MLQYSLPTLCDVAKFKDLKSGANNWHIDLEVVKEVFLFLHVFCILGSCLQCVCNYEGLQASPSENWKYDVTAEFWSPSLLRKPPNISTLQQVLHSAQQNVATAQLHSFSLSSLSLHSPILQEEQVTE